MKIFGLSISRLIPALPAEQVWPRHQPRRGARLRDAVEVGAFRSTLVASVTVVLVPVCIVMVAQVAWPAALAALGLVLLCGACFCVMWAVNKAGRRQARQDALRARNEAEQAMVSPRTPAARVADALQIPTPRGSA